MANLIGFCGSTLPTGPSLADGYKLDTVGFIFVDILHNDIVIKDVKFLISWDVAIPILSHKILKKKCLLIPEDFPFMQIATLDTGQPAPVANASTNPPAQLSILHQFAKNTFETNSFPRQG